MKRMLAIALSMIMGLSLVGGMANAEDTGLGIVKTAQGQVLGVFENGVTYYKGIPFAKPPVGDLRWAAPEDPEPWEGVKACDTYAPMAMQILSTEDWWGEEFYYEWIGNPPAMSEDCLYLNVVTPALSGDENYPVLVWFHGGASMHGYSYEPEFEPAKLVEKGVIVVSVPYRLGVFGWMGTEALSAASPTGTSGNYGLLDQIQSLKWVQENITAFGGDPGRVTIAGQSAGASCVTSLLTSPLAEGLFHRAILDSSFGALGTRTPLTALQERCDAYLAEKGYGDMTVEELRALPTSAFMNETTEKSEVYNKGFGACLDGYVLTEDPKDFFLREDSLRGKHLFFGSNSGEGNGSFTLSTQDELFEAAKSTYGALYGAYDFETLYKATDDIAATLESLRLRSERGGIQNLIIGEVLSRLNPDSSLYTYYFSHRTPGREEDIRWAWHSSELWYTFNSLRDILEQRDWKALDYKIADDFSSYWANFIATGDPNGDELPYWPQVTDKTPVMMDMGDTFKLRGDFYGGTKMEGRDLLMREYIITSNGLEEYYN